MIYSPIYIYLIYIGLGALTAVIHDPKAQDGMNTFLAGQAFHAVCGIVIGYGFGGNKQSNSFSYICGVLAPALGELGWTSKTPLASLLLQPLT